MNWTVFIIAFCIAVVTGASAASLLARIRPEWGERRRLLVAALLLPSITALGALAGLVAVLVSAPGSGENMQDLALAAIGTMGALFALIALVGGLIGAALRQRGLGR